MTDREEFRKRRKERARVNDDEASRDRVVEEDNGGRIGVIDIVRLLGGLILLNCLLSYFVTNDSLLWGWRPWFVRPGVVMGWFVHLSSSDLHPSQPVDIHPRMAQSSSPTPNYWTTMAPTPQNRYFLRSTAPSTM